MQDILELTDIVTKNTVKEIRTLRTCDCRPKERVDELYDLIQTHRPQDHDSCAQLMGYPGGKDKGYLEIVTKLRERLHNSVVFIDANSPKFSDAQKAFYSCQKLITIARILLGRYARASAIELAERVMRKSLEFEIYEISLEAAIMIREHHAFRTGRHSVFHSIQNRIQEYEDIVAAEKLAKYYHQHLHVALIRSATPNQDYFDLARKYIDELSAIRATIKSFGFNLIYYSMKVELALHSKDFEQVISECSESLDFFATKKFAPPHFILQFRYWIFQSHVLLQKNDDAEETFSEIREVFESGTVRWYNTYELRFLMLMRMQDYDRAGPIYSTVVQQTSFRYQPEKRQETWRTYRAFLYYLKMIGRLEIELQASFRLRKFLNEIPIFSKDKRGYNITVLIIQILILLQQKKYDQLTDRIEAIEKYTSRYLRNDENFRSNCFIKMLLQIPKRNFHRVAVLRHAKPYIKRLATVPLEKSKQSYEIEIIPYEHLWEYALDSLER